MASPLGGPNIGIGGGNGAPAPRATAPTASAGVLGAPPTGNTPTAPTAPTQTGGGLNAGANAAAGLNPNITGTAVNNGWNSVPGFVPTAPTGVNGAVVGAPTPAGLTPDQQSMFNSVGWYNPTPAQTYATFNAGADGQAMAAANGGTPLYNIGANGNVTVSNPGINQVGGNMALTGGPGNGQNSGLLQFLQNWAQMQQSLQNPTNPSAQITNSLDGSGTGSTDLTTLLGLLGGYGSYNPYGLSNYTRQQLQWPTFA